MGAGATHSGSFCTGPGHVMMGGFQHATGPDAPCMLYLFPGWVLDSAVKYSFAVLGTFLLGVLNHGLLVARREAVAYCDAKGCNKATTATVGALMYGAQMFVAYCLMLLVSSLPIAPRPHRCATGHALRVGHLSRHPARPHGRAVLDGPALRGPDARTGCACRVGGLQDRARRHGQGNPVLRE
jgi:hypothetical protein